MQFPVFLLRFQRSFLFVFLSKVRGNIYIGNKTERSSYVTQYKYPQFKKYIIADSNKDEILDTPYPPYSPIPPFYPRQKISLSDAIFCPKSYGQRSRELEKSSSLKRLKENLLAIKMGREKSFYQLKGRRTTRIPCETASAHFFSLSFTTKLFSVRNRALLPQQRSVFLFHCIVRVRFHCSSVIPWEGERRDRHGIALSFKCLRLNE